MPTNQTLAQRREQASELIAEIEADYRSISEVKKTAKSVLSSLKTDTGKFKRQISSLNRISSNLDEAIEGFRLEKKRINSILIQAEKFYNTQFVPLKSKITDPETGFRKKIKDFNSLSKQLDKIESSCNKKYDEVEQTISNFKNSVSQLRPIDVAIRKLHESSVKNKTDSDAILTRLISIEKRAAELRKAIGQIKSESQAHLVSIENLKNEGKVKVDDIGANLKLSRETLAKIQEVYNIAAETGLSGEFENRRNNLKSDLSKWENRIFYISLTLLVSFLVLFILQLIQLNWKIADLKWSFYARLLVFSPIIYYLFFCATQYSKVNKLYDKYSFKTTMAMSIKHHIDLLIKQQLFVDNTRIDKVLDFVLEAFGKIYNEPYSDEDYKMKLKLSSIEVDLEKKVLDLINSKQGFTQ
jgi:predicted  nucleic acid-binding Zn-ribbon protein